MLDLHLFLGRPPQNVYSPGAGDVEGVGGDGEGDEGLQDRAPKGYEVTELTPDLVHYGNFPQQVRPQGRLCLRVEGATAWRMLIRRLGPIERAGFLESF